MGREEGRLLRKERDKKEMKRKRRKVGGEAGGVD
jgi:hypothetical protein